ncbi:MAG: protein kinase domain-containing protein [Bdellovibrionota bacterium]
MAFRPHKFGRYIIVDPIAVGGMAEIYRARLAAAKEGPDRVIVIKKVIANLQANPEFLQMFEEEIKITVGLTHPNIIQIYDYGKVDEQYFMAMEYVEGKNLRQFVKRLADMKSMFSIDMSCYIISQTCHALGYAHSYKDRLTGKTLGIVHRDISPQNVMISYDGAVKLFDFGIAKAKSANEATRAGVIKGKPSYLSPEQINGEELDGRSDIFALGICLWELLTAKRLFVADTDMGVLRLIQNAKIEPPSTFNPAVPQSLDAIVLKSLQRDKNKRYQNAEEFQRDLHKFLYSFNPSFNPSDLSYYAQELFKTEIRDDRERLTKFLAIEPVGSGDGFGTPETSQGPKKPALSNKLAEGLISTTDFNREMMDLVTAQNTGKIRRPTPDELKATVPSAAPAISPPEVDLNKVRQASTSISGRAIAAPPAGSPQRTENMVIPPWSKQAVGTGSQARKGTNSASLRREMDDQHKGGRNVAVLLCIMVVVMVVGARQYGILKGTPLAFLAPAEESTRTPAGIPTPAPTPVSAPNPDFGAKPEPAAAPTSKAISPEQLQGLVVLQSRFSDLRVLVNGKAVAVNNNQFPVPLNQAVTIDVTKRGYQPVQFQVTVKDRAPVSYRVELTELPSGALVLTTTPDAQATIYSGEEVVFKGRTPFRERLPVGRYKVVLENSLLNYKGELEVVIELNKNTQMERFLK